MPGTRIWTLPESLDDGFPYRLADMTHVVGGCLYYAKAGNGVLGMLEPAARRAHEWVIPAEAAPAAVAPGNTLGSASRLSLTPGRAPKVWCTIDAWHALGEFDPVLGQLRVYSSAATGPVNEGGVQPFAAPRCVLAESATRIWFGARSYPDRNPLIGLLDTAAARVVYWTLGGPAAHGTVEDLVIGADGRLWFACSSQAGEGENVAFLGVLDTHNRWVHYWMAPGVLAVTPDRTVGARRLGAQRPRSATRVWLVLRNAYRSMLLQVDAASGAMLQYGAVNLPDGQFDIAVPGANRTAVGYRDFFRLYDNVSGCRFPVEFEASTAEVRAVTADVRISVGKGTAVKTKLQTRKVQTLVTDQACWNTLTPEAPSLCDFLRVESGGRLWLGRQTGNEIGLYTP